MAELFSKAIKPSELFRDRVVARYYHATQRLLDYDPTVPCFVPQSSSDTALTAFCQLGALRLNATRCLISLIDSRHQYVLAEATKTLSMQSDLRHDVNDALWLGSVVIPRTKGICEVVLESPERAHSRVDGHTELYVTVFSNLQERPRFQSLPNLPATSDLHFYAGVPIMLKDGTRLGAYCIFDNKPRAGLSANEESFMHDMARTVMDHLEAIRIRTDYRRRHKLVNGLESFIDGLADVKSLTHESSSNGEIESFVHAQPAPSEGNVSEPVTNITREESVDTPDPASLRTAKDPRIALWESALPVGSKSMFSRAANIIRQSGDYDGVAFFYVSSASTREQETRRQTQNSERPRRRQSSDSRYPNTSSSHASSGDSDPLDSGQSLSEREDIPNAGRKSAQSPCSVLSFSLNPNVAVDGSQSRGLFSDFQNRDLNRLLGKNPRGRTFTLNQQGLPLPGDTSSSGSSAEKTSANASSKRVLIDTDGSERSKARIYKVTSAQVRSLRKVSADGRSFVCLPLWDYERQRWFAYSICWSNAGNRDPGMEGDLHFLRIFGNSIMIALSHIDAIAANQAKTSFVSSISHELRSPLHGMLGATNFLQDSSLDRFQREMVDSISNSGRTLLDTIEHIMDFAKINSFSSEIQSTKSISTPGMPRGRQSVVNSSLTSTVDIAVLLEEVVDTVLTGFTVQHDFIYADEIATPSRVQPNFNTSPRILATSFQSQSQRGRIRIALQIPFRQSWYGKTQAGAWRRIIMNLFGNALKYTSDGLIIIRLEDIENTVHQSHKSLHLSIIDTGKGISKDYLENRLFLPFSQEDSFASGTGLGLSIVNQVVRSMGGKLDVRSVVGRGTTVDVDLTIETADTKNSIMRPLDPVESVADQIRGWRICLLQQPDEELNEDAARGSAEKGFSNCIATMLHDWFGIESTYATSWTPGNADVVLCLRPSFKHLESIRDSGEVGHVPPVILIAYDALEMAVLRADARVSNEKSIVEIISQPVGPRKFARTFEHFLERKQTDAEAHERKKQSTSLSLTTSDQDQRSSSPVTMSLIQTELNSSPSRQQSSPNGNNLADGVKILIVDDNKLNLRLLAAFLKKLAIQYLEATNGQDAVDLYKKARGSIKCILMDISMPVMDGMTATRRIRKFENENSLPRANILALTGLASTAARSEAQEAGMDGFLTKPISFNLLNDVLPRSPLFSPVL